MTSIYFQNLDIQDNIGRFLRRVDMGKFCLTTKHIICDSLKKQMKIEWEVAKQAAKQAERESHYESIIDEYWGCAPHKVVDTSTNELQMMLEPRYDDPTKTDSLPDRPTGDYLLGLLISPHDMWPHSMSTNQYAAFVEIIHNLIEFNKYIGISYTYIKEIDDTRVVHIASFPFGPYYPPSLQNSNQLNLLRKTWKSLESAMYYRDIIDSSINSGKYIGLIDEVDLEFVQLGIVRNLNDCVTRANASVQLRQI